MYPKTDKSKIKPPFNVLKVNSEKKESLYKKNPNLTN